MCQQWCQLTLPLGSCDDCHCLPPFVSTGRDMFFSYTYDITMCAQRLAAMLADPSSAGRPLAARADPRFTWNRAGLKALVDAGAGR